MGAPLQPASVSIGRIREVLDGVVRHLRATDRFSRMRTAIVAAWVLVSVATVFASCPGSRGNSLGAEFQVLSDSFVGGEQLLVRNESNDTWRDVVLTLDGDWRYEQRVLRPHERIVVSPSRFQRRGESAPEGYLPRTLEVECDQGSHTFKVR
ncbi:MAG TPA: hypothetical protein VFK85_05930 [Anaeromyxobacteraceae bacterium]|nr:hypothetical protein [Anaeromyxobacteraceae bacterium]